MIPVTMPKKTKPLPKLEYLQELFAYEDGELYWRVYRRGGTAPGKKAGTVNGNGYKVVGIDYKKYQVHRIIWVLNGNPEDEFIDHINGNKTDNRIENLRAVDMHGNNCNIGLRRDSTSGIKGVSWSKATRKWVGQVWHQHKLYRAGAFDSKEECALAVQELRCRLHREFARHQ